MENRICSFVIAIVNTTDFQGYVHQMSNHMAVDISSGIERFFHLNLSIFQFNVKMLSDICRYFSRNWKIFLTVVFKFQINVEI